ncbi:MAG TPA: hypothetical protein VG167_13340 [Verrucomicrobiae bacterium]|nr:hypothetical protein [Verrucomicrobiae bacterium]
MATRINLMKMLQEVRGLAELTNWHPLPRHDEPVLLPRYTARRGRLRRIVRVSMKSPPDIPTPVRIRYIQP